MTERRSGSPRGMDALPPLHGCLPLSFEYDHSSDLTAAEATALRVFVEHRFDQAGNIYEQCVHRLACAKCPLYRAKPSTLEANTEGVAHLTKMTRMQQTLTLTDDELAAVTEGAELLQALVDRLKDRPTPGGPTPRQLERGGK